MSKDEFGGKDEKRDEKDEKEGARRQEKTVEEKWTRDPLVALVWASILIWAGVVLLFLLSRGMDLLLLGDEAAFQSGLSVERVKTAVYLTASLLAGTVVAYGDRDALAETERKIAVAAAAPATVTASGTTFST